MNPSAFTRYPLGCTTLPFDVLMLFDWPLVVLKIAEASGFKLLIEIFRISLAWMAVSAPKILAYSVSLALLKYPIFFVLTQDPIITISIAREIVLAMAVVLSWLKNIGTDRQST
jgi:hypothetical protein